MQSAAEEDGTGFSYSGQLLFNGIYASTVKNQNNKEPTAPKTKERVLSQIPAINESNDTGPRSGVRSLDLDEYIDKYDFDADDAKLSKSIHPDLVSDLLDLEYVQEEFTKQARVVTEDGQRTSGEIIKEHSANLYWDLTSILLVHGAKPDRKRAMRAVYNALGITNENAESQLKIEPIEFDPWFLFWLIYRDANSKPVGSKLDVLRIRDIRLKQQANVSDTFGDRTQVSGSTDAVESVQVITGLLHGMLPTGLEAKFDVGGEYLIVDITSSGRIHIRAEEAIGAASKLERVFLGIQFVQDLVQAQQKWEYYDPEEKFVSPRFSKTLYDSAKSQNVSIDFDKELVRRQVEKRGESLEDWEHLDFS